jgi:nitrite reductase (NADH) large subunit
MATQQETAWRCDICGYVHHGAEPPETCPICGADSDAFVREQDEPAPAKPAATQTASFECMICGYVHEGEEPPETCPVCNADADCFQHAAATEAAPRAGTPGGERILIIGGGIAGFEAARAARRQNAEAQVVLLSREAELPYYRLNLTRFLAGEIDDGDLPVQPENWYDDQAVDIRLNTEVKQIDPDGRTVLLADGSREGYDKAVLCAGAHPFVPPIPGMQRDGVTTLRTADQTRALRDSAGDGLRCLCIGGGLLGLETAGALVAQGAQVTVVEGAPWLLPRQLDEVCGGYLAECVRERGIDLQLGRQVAELVGDESVREVVLDDDTRIPVDRVVVSAGIRANSWLARQAGLEVNRGVVVNRRLQTSHPDIFAAGDVSEHRGVCYGIWPAAHVQGGIAGANAAGGELTFDGLERTNTLKVLGIGMMSLGLVTTDDGSYTIAADTGAAGARRFVCHDNQLAGAALVGDIALAPACKAAMEAGLDLSPVARPGCTTDEIAAFLGEHTQP